MKIVTWDSFLDNRKRINNKTIWFFSSPEKLPQNSDEWDRAIIIDGNTREYTNNKWNDTWKLTMPIGLPWAPGKDWERGADWVTPNKMEIAERLYAMFDKPKDWLNGRDWNDGLPWRDGRDGRNGKDAVIDYDKLVKMVIDRLQSDDLFILRIKWADWVDGKDGKNWRDWRDWRDWLDASAAEVCTVLLQNSSFLEKCKIKWDKWEPGESVQLRDVVFQLKHDEEFVNSCKIKWDKGETWTMFQFDNLTPEQIEKLRWPKWEIGEPWAKGVDAERILIMYSPDGVNNISYKYKEWDKYIHILQWKKTDVFQIVFN